MRKIVVVGGSKGIGHAIVQSLIEENIVVNISRTAPLQPHANLTHYNCDILTDDLPEIEAIDTLIYCPGSINLKPIARLKLQDFREDFEINVIGAVESCPVIVTNAVEFPTKGSSKVAVILTVTSSA